MILTRSTCAIGALAIAGLTLTAAPMTSAQADDAARIAPLIDPSSDADRAIAGSYIVVLDKASSLASVTSVSAAATAAGGTVRHEYGSAIKGFSATLPAAALAEVRAAPGVAYVEQQVEESLALPVTTSTTQPNATWGIDRVDQRDLPLDQSYTFVRTGLGVRAYIIDTGINFTHNEFQGRAVSGPDFRGNDNDSTDCNGHGTHVAGTIGGRTYGMAKQVTLVGLRTINCLGFGSTGDTIAAIDWVTANNEGRGVINMSLRFTASQAMNDSVHAAYDAGILSAVAAGNFTQDACIESPAQEPTAVTIGATEIDDNEASFSNFGSCVDIYAPGVDITSAWIGSNSATEVLSGTSMAAPHVAGAIAKLLQAAPDGTSQQITQALIQRSTKNTISPLHPNTANRLLYSRNA